MSVAEFYQQAHDQLVPGDHLVADDADGRPGDTPADMGRVAVFDELADALGPGEDRAGPDDHRDPDPGQVLGPFQAIGIVLGRRAPDSRKPRNTTKLVETSDRLWIASPSSPTEPVSRASSNSTRPVAASPIALTAMARLAYPGVPARRRGCWPGGTTRPGPGPGDLVHSRQDDQKQAPAANRAQGLPQWCAEKISRTSRAA